MDLTLGNLNQDYKASRCESGRIINRILALIERNQHFKQVVDFVVLKQMAGLQTSFLAADSFNVSKMNFRGSISNFLQLSIIVYIVAAKSALSIDLEP